jgi:predicted transcriptional regulator
MARTKDKEKAALVSRLGLSEKQGSFYTKTQLQARLEKKLEEDSKLAEQKAMTQLIAGEVPDVPPAQMHIPYSPKEIEDPFSGLTEKQKLIARLRMRGLSQEAIANVVGVSQVWISKELKRIKEWQAERGRDVNQEEVVGNAASLYEEVEYRAWELYHSAEEIADKAKSLAVIMQAREKQTKLLMDLGLIKKADINVKHTLEVSPFIQQWKNGEAKKSLGDAIVAKQLPDLQDPTPDTGIDDAEVLEEDEEADQQHRSEHLDDLAEPAPEDLVLDDE